MLKLDGANESLFSKIANAGSWERAEVLNNLAQLVKDAGLSYALMALFRQQVNCGLVLADPLKLGRENQKSFFDPETNVTFSLNWNPYRLIRLNHVELVKRGVIHGNVDQSKLINRDKRGKACYLCKANIDLQNPKEILWRIDLAGGSFYIGANIAFIMNNHFTIMNELHISQVYDKVVIESLNDFVDKVDGCFRVISNGLAGASIKEHLHLQAVSNEFPIERICVKDGDLVYQKDGVVVYVPAYYLTVWIIEGRLKEEVNSVAHMMIQKWFELNIQYHTINIIAVKDAEKRKFRTFIIPRDIRKLYGAGKRGTMAAFEAGGYIVLSGDRKQGINDGIDERGTFNNADLGLVKQMLRDISSSKEACEDLVRWVEGFG